MKALTITTTEAKRLKGLENTIKAGLGTVLKVAEALMEIKENRLYRAKYKTFEEYCEQKWQVTRRRAYQLIEAGEVRNSLTPEMGNNFPNTAQLNALAKIPKEQRQAAAEAIIESVKTKGGKVTASRIKAANPMRGVDTTKLDAPVLTATQHEEAGKPEPEVADPSDPAQQPETTTPPIEPKMTLRWFESAIKALEQKAEAAADNQAERTKYGTILNAAAGRMLNPVKREYNPYGR